jgi:hypothetical protein
MDDRLQEIETRLRALDATLADVVRRLDRLDGLGDAVPSPADDAVEEPVEAVATGSFDVVPLAGRTLIVLGGAFLLRALTESGQLPNGVGVGLGLLYAVASYLAADRAAAAGRPASSLFHGIAAVIISLPLVWEASTRFGMFEPATSATAVGLLTGLALLVAWRHSLQSLAGVGTVGAVVALLALGVAVDHMASFTVLAVVLGLVAWWFGESRLGWMWLRWPPAAAATLLALALIPRTVAEPPREGIVAALLASLFFVGVYLVAFGWRTLVRVQPIGLFEAVMASVVIGVGFGGALIEASSTGATSVFLMLGVTGLLASSAFYGLAVAIVRRRQGRGSNYVFYTSLALAFLILGCGALLDGSALAFAVAVLAFLATVLGSRGTLPTLTLHGSILAVAATIVSGLLAAAGVWIGIVQVWPVLSLPAWIALVTLSVCLMTPRPTTWDQKAILASVGRGILAAVFALSAGTAVLIVLGPLVAGTPPDPGVLASAKTVVLALAAVALALASHRNRLAEFGWFVYPVLVIGGLQLLLEAFRLSAPSTLFVAMALYGAALVLGPRLKSSAAQPFRR